MNLIEIEYKNGMFYVCWIKEPKPDRLLFVTGRHPEETPQEARKLAEEGAMEWREKHPEIGDIVFKR